MGLLFSATDELTTLVLARPKKFVLPVTRLKPKRIERLPNSRSPYMNGALSAPVAGPPSDGGAVSASAWLAEVSPWSVEGLVPGCVGEVDGVDGVPVAVVSGLVAGGADEGHGVGPQLGLPPSGAGRRVGIGSG